MQEEATQKTVVISTRALKLSSKILQSTIKEFLKRKDSGLKGKKQNLGTLVKKGGKLTNIDIKANRIKEFDQIAKKYHVAYSVMRNEKDDNGLKNYLIFFRSDDVDRMDAAFRKYAQRKLQPEKDSIIGKLQQTKGFLKQSHEHIKEKGLEL